MKICFFGIYDPTYARNRVLIEGLEAHGHTIVHCRVNTRESKGFKKFWHLFKKARALKSEKIDAVIVAFPGHSIVWLAYVLFGRNIIFDAFLSLYDSNVFDRKRYGPHSLGAYRDWILDWYSTNLASCVLIDTNQHIDYFAKHFFVAQQKMVRILIGADIQTFFPRERPQSEKFIVHFHGTFIPLQGLSYILEAVLQLKDSDVIVHIVGDGQEGKFVRECIEANGNPEHIKLIGKVPVTEVPHYIAQADVCLGIFGHTEKTLRVIPNKVYEYLAMGKVVITADTPAMREVFTEHEIVMCKVADGESLRKAILEIKNNPEKRQALVQASYTFFKKNLYPASIVEPLITFLKQRS